MTNYPELYPEVITIIIDLIPVGIICFELHFNSPQTGADFPGKPPYLVTNIPAILGQVSRLQLRIKKGIEGKTQ